MELISDEGFRLDGRRANDLRNIVCRIGVFTQADGSGYFEIGNTRVIAAVFGPHDVQKNARSERLQAGDRAIVNCQFSQAVFSTSSRRNQPRGDFRALEITEIVKEVFETAVLCETYPHSQIDIFLEVLQADGSVLAACMNAASLAMIHSGIAMKDIVVAATSGYLSNTAVMDINSTEENANCPLYSVAMLGQTKEILSLEVTGRVSLDNMMVIQNTAINAATEVYKSLRNALIKEMDDDYDEAEDNAGDS